MGESTKEKSQQEAKTIRSEISKMTLATRPYFRRLIEKHFSEITEGDSFQEWETETEKRDFELPSMESPEDLSDDDRAYWIAEEAVNHWMINEDECFFEEQKAKAESDSLDMHWENKISQAMEER